MSLQQSYFIKSYCTAERVAGAASEIATPLKREKKNSNELEPEPTELLMKKVSKPDHKGPWTKEVAYCR